MRIPFTVYDFFAYLATGFIVLIAADFSFDLGWMVKEKIPPGVVLFLVVAGYMIGHMVANLSSFLLEHKFLRGVLGSPEENLFKNKERNLWSFLFPVYFDPLPPETQLRIRERAKNAGVNGAGRGLFFHCFTIVKRDKASAERLAVFLNLYGFCRNSCMALLLSSALLLYGGFYKMNWPTLKGIDNGKLIWAGVGVFVAVAMFYRYLKFFKTYTVEVFRDYAEPIAN